jgi:nitrate/nitrite transport system ATP-binding protein
MITHDVDEAVLLSDRIIMMTNGPAAAVGKDLHINLQRPRNRVRLANDPTYVHYRQEVLRFLYEKQQTQEGVKVVQAAPAKRAKTGSQSGPAIKQASTY